MDALTREAKATHLCGAHSHKHVLLYGIIFLQIIQFTNKKIKENDGGGGGWYVAHQKK
jgi:hypothetical protein